MYIGMYLGSSTPTYIPKKKKRLLPFLSSWEQCTSREVSYYNKVYREKELNKNLFVLMEPECGVKLFGADETLRTFNLTHTRKIF